MAKRNHAKDMMEMPHELKEIVSDYKIKVYEIAWLTEEQVASFQSDFRIIADYFVQMRKTGYYRPSPQEKMIHAREVLQLMSVLTKDNRFERAYNKSKKGKEPKTMCEVLDRIENQGRREGRKEGRKEGRREGLQIGIKEFIGICRRFNMSDEEICLEIKGRFQITKAQAERFVKGIY